MVLVTERAPSFSFPAYRQTKKKQQTKNKPSDTHVSVMSCPLPRYKVCDSSIDHEGKDEDDEHQKDPN